MTKYLQSMQSRETKNLNLDQDPEDIQSTMRKVGWSEEKRGKTVEPAGRNPAMFFFGQSHRPISTKARSTGPGLVGPGLVGPGLLGPGLLGPNFCFVFVFVFVLLLCCCVVCSCLNP